MSMNLPNLGKQLACPQSQNIDRLSTQKAADKNYVQDLGKMNMEGSVFDVAKNMQKLQNQPNPSIF